MYLLGAGGHAEVILDIVKQNGHTIKGFFDDNLELLEFSGMKSQGAIQNAKNISGPYIIAIGANRVRQIISDSLMLDFSTAIHPNAIVHDSVKIGEGTVVMAGAVINIDCSIGKHAIINTGAVVDHDCIIEDYAHISPNATLCGNVEVGVGTHLGAGSIVIPGIKIGKWCTIGAGAVIINDVPDFSTVVGNPGRIIKRNYGKG